MSTFQTKRFREDQIAKGHSPEEVDSFLTSKGFDPTLPSQSFNRGAKGLAVGAAKGAGNTAFDMASFGEKLLEGTVGKGIEKLTGVPRPAPIYGEKPTSLTPVGPSEQRGAKVEKVAEFAVPAMGGAKAVRAVAQVPSFVRSLASGTGRAAANVGSKAAEVVVGTKPKSAISQAFSKPADVGAFKSGKASIQTVANRANEAINAVENTSRAKFDDVISKLPGNKVSRTRVIDQIRNDTVENLGISGKKLTLKSLKDTGMSDNEATVILRLFNRVRAHGDWTDKGVIKLRQSIDKGGFYKPDNTDFSSSNKIVGRVRRALNRSAEEVTGDDALKTALKEATDDIELMEQLGFTVRGTNAERNVEATATKLRTLINRIDDPMEREATRKLLATIKERTGADLEDMLRSAGSAKQLGADLPGITSPLATIQSLLTRGVGGAASMVGRATGQQPKSTLFDVIKSRIAPKNIPLPKIGSSQKSLREALEARVNEAKKHAGVK